MKFSVIAAALFSAAVVKASFYEVTFESAEIAQNCVQIDAQYLHKVSTDYSVTGNALSLVTAANACSASIQLNIKEVCGGVVTSTCTEL
jgi:hypothetical protein